MLAKQLPWLSSIAFYDPKRKIIVSKGSSRACGGNYNRFSIHAEQRAINYCRECNDRKGKRYQIFIWRYAKDGTIKPSYCCNACSQLVKKYNFNNKVFTFENGKKCQALVDNPQISLGYKIHHNI